jgi:hypothetical protein
MVVGITMAVTTTAGILEAVTAGILEAVTVGIPGVVTVGIPGVVTVGIREAVTVDPWGAAVPTVVTADLTGQRTS